MKISKHTKSNFDKYIIIHGCPPSENNIIPKSQRWMNWIGKELIKRGLNAFAPDMPTPWNPKYEGWKREFEKYSPNENTLLIGHSCGAAFLVRWLLESKIKVRKLILVAPAKVPEGPTDKRKALYDFELRPESKKIAGEIVIFTSNDFEHHLKSLEFYKKYLNPRVIKLKNKVHFLIYTMGTNEFPELLDEILYK